MSCGCVMRLWTRSSFFTQFGQAEIQGAKAVPGDLEGSQVDAAVRQTAQKAVTFFFWREEEEWQVASLMMALDLTPSGHRVGSNATHEQIKRFRSAPAP